MLNKGENAQMRILIAEDDHDIRYLLVRNAKKSGFQPIEAFDGEDAIVKFEKNPDILALVADGSMPVLCGNAVISHVKRRNPNVFCVLSSASEGSSLVADLVRPKPQGRKMFEELKVHLLAQQTAERAV